MKEPRKYVPSDFIVTLEALEADFKEYTKQYKSDIDAMKTVMTRFTVMENKVAEHDNTIKNLDSLVIRGSNGTASMLEDIRIIKGFQQSIKFWLTAVALGFLGQGIVMFIAILVWLVQKVFQP